MKKIHVGFLVSYDYKLLKNAIPCVYEDADRIFLAIDSNRKTWNGNDIIIDNKFFEWIKAYDKDSKIEIYEDEFYVKGLSTMDCDVKERKMLSDKMGVGNWLIQLDADEYFINFKGFVAYLKSKNKYLDNPGKHKVQIAPFKINLYKYIKDGVLYVEKPDKFMAATNYPNYKVSRSTRERKIYTNFMVLHESISRSREELVMKLENWGHNDEIDKDAYLKKWDSVNETNYKTMRDFFYLEPEGWKTIELMKGKNMDELLASFAIYADKVMPSKFYLWKKNFGQWFKFLFK